MHRLASGADQPAAVGERDSILAQGRLEGLEVTGLGGGEEGGEQVVALGAADDGSPLLGDVLARPARQLARVGLAHLKNFGDPLERIVERFVEYVRCALRGREPLQEQQHRERERLGVLGPERRVGGRVDGLRQPGSDIDLPSSPRGAEGGEAEPGHHRGEIGGRIGDIRPIGRLPAQPRILHHVLGVGSRPEHAVGDPEQATAVLLEELLLF